MVFDLKTYQFTHEPTGFVLHAEDVMMESNGVIRLIIYGGTGVWVDDFYVDVLRDTIEQSEPDFGGAWK